ncbi:hypothetical protein PFICI_02552 [Pestalotiopsis fici W106-1]|uniref:Thioesterase domain-containing protein n=1 Tax=Pestalotiopsis fici (strain W106-1 / CGMCC3.15140) TaxID=1229662 RepID=W3XGG8_PESFW|nr:uncharacterized protein PFICI_02552 [Pestalotiopsis fici W106-1]ETS84527.1 hypothetical protein PFICI_02552 [Pestalotiopsis fici W106-1]
MIDRLINGFQALSYGSLLGLGLLFGIAAANYKALPFVSTLRILPAVLRLLKPRLPPWHRAVKAKIAAVTPPGVPFATAPALTSLAASPRLFRHQVTTSRAVAADLDINVHKSNSTFFADADIGRTRLLADLLSDGLAGLGPANFILAGAQCRFLREVRPYAAYDVSSRVLAWTDRSFYVVTYFLKPRAKLPFEIDVLGGPQALLSAADDGLRRKVYAVLVTKFVFKAGRATVAPEQILRASGLLVDDDGSNTDGGEKTTTGVGLPREGMLHGQNVDAAVKAGLEYVARCME